MDQNPDKINWEDLSENPNAIHLMDQNPDKINWEELSRNPNAIHLLEANPEKIDWYNLSRNPSIFEIDKTQYKIDITEKANNIDRLI